MEALKLAFETVVGSTITPVACQFLNDSDMLGKILPTEENIQASTYQNMGIPAATDQAIPAKIKLVSLSSPGSGQQGGYNAEFLHDEGALLLRGPERCERLNRLHEQLTVLRGATFSAAATAGDSDHAVQRPARAESISEK